MRFVDYNFWINTIVGKEMKRFVIAFHILMITGHLYSQSVLSSGEWHKVGVTETGIYKIDQRFIKKELGAGDIDPATFKVYGIKGGMLPQKNAIARPNDPVQIPLLGFGDQDGSLDSEDYFLFYAEGPDGFSLDSIGNPRFENNIYSDTAYFFITYGGDKGLRVGKKDSQTISGNKTSSYTKYFNHEVDLENQLRSGRMWVGESFRRNDNPVRQFSYDLPEDATEVTAWLRMAGNTQAACTFDISINDTNIGSIDIPPTPDVQWGDKIKFLDLQHFSTSTSGKKLDIKFSFNAAPNVSTSIGYIDGFTLEVSQALSLENTNHQIIYLKSDKSSTFSIAGADNQSLIWDITNPTEPISVIGNLSGSNLEFSNDAGSDHFIVFDQSAEFSTPEYFQKIENQNIKSFANSTAIIITHPRFLSAAEALASFHRSHDGLNVNVVTTWQVYNEFGAGRQDISAIRDYLRYCYLEGHNLKYALLFGDASYDYKYRIANNTNFVPVYESRNSSSNLKSYSSDDYYGLLEENEGYWSEDSVNQATQNLIKYGDDETMEIGIGRLPAKTIREAEQMVDKIVRYTTSSQEFGKWRTQVAYFTDDGDSNIHMIQAESFYKIIDTLATQYSVQKIYLDLYDQSNTNQEPPARTAIKNALKDGLFLFDYMGHGNTDMLTEENIFNLEVIHELTNRIKLPLFVTATCEFGEYDNPKEVSGAERLVLNDNGGAIGILCTTRPVYANTNFLINRAFHQNVFDRSKQRYYRLGDIIRHTKNDALRGSINRNFALLGDPMLKPNFPKYDVTFDQMSSKTDTLSALETFHLSGKIMSSGTLVSDFNGQAVVTLYDIPQSKITRGQENDPFEFTDQNNALFRGEVTVKSGIFELDFVLPKNISYQYKPGKLTIYAWNGDNHIDATGATRNFVLGGTATTTEEDKTPPSAHIYINDENFKNGTTVGPNSLFIAQIKDENGINISSDGLIQGLTLQLNNQEPINLNPYFTAGQDTYKEGSVIYPLQNLPAGNYTATLKVHDAYNNEATSSVEFKVSSKPILRLYNALNFPNPVHQFGETTFKFEHDREDEELLIDLFIYNMNGQMVREVNFDLESSPRVVDFLTIKAYDQHGAALDNGIYTYRMVVTSTLDHATSQVVKRLIIIN